MKMENKDYKKLYEEALERAKVVNKGTEDYNIVTTIFPELIESEDEKIRKEIISLIKETHVTDRYYDLNKMLAWLEKQGEQKPQPISVPFVRIVDDCVAKCWEPGGVCNNPHRDCIGCPKDWN